MANVDEIVGYGGAGASIGTAILPGVGTAIGAGVGATVGTLKGWYDRHQNKKNRLRLEALNSKMALGRNEEIEKAILLQNESASSIINQQLDRSIKATDIAYAQSGAYQTGGRLKAENQMRTDATDSIIRAAGANALQGQALKQNALQMDRSWDLQMAQLEGAKQSGDIGAISSIAEQLVPALLGQIQGGKSKGINPESLGSSTATSTWQDYSTAPDVGSGINIPASEKMNVDSWASQLVSPRVKPFASDPSSQWRSPSVNSGTDAIDFLYKGGL